MSAQRPKEDVLVHYDEHRGELVFFTVSAEATATLRRSGFGGIRPTVEELQALPPSDAMRRVGGTVLGLLDLSSSVQLGITRSSQQDAEGNSEL